MKETDEAIELLETAAGHLTSVGDKGVALALRRIAESISRLDERLKGLETKLDRVARM